MWFQALYNYIYNYIFPPPPPVAPPPGRVYGYLWQAGMGVPPALGFFNPNDPLLPNGLYVGFTGSVLSGATDNFGRMRGVGPVFVPPVAVSAGLTALVTAVAANPPPGEAAWWTAPANNLLRDIDGFLAYVATCLDLINQTVPGAALLTSLSAAAVKPTMIIPGMLNQTTGGAPPGMTTLTRGLAGYAANGALPAALIHSAVQAHYPMAPNDAARYNQLAVDLNASELYTLFDTAANMVPNYLGANFTYNGAPIAGGDLLTWCNGAGNPGFDNAVRVAPAGADAVLPIEALLQALTVILNPQAVAGTGTRPGISFDTALTAKNDHADPNFRPPAVGLAHELMHAWHYSHGISPGYDNGVFSATVAELKFSGIGPFAADPITENAIRLAWGGVVGADPSNTWLAPVARLIYSPPTNGRTIPQMRTAFGCL